MPTLLYKDYGLVKGVGFDSWRRVGTATQSIKVYDLRQVDELVFMDISATKDGRGPDFPLIDELADECFMPMTVGGGIRTIEDVRGLLQVGADKIAINTAAVESPGLIREVADRFGSQCVVVSIDARRKADGGYELYTHSATRPRGICPFDFAAEAQRQGAGEVLITSIDRDGTFEGYDVELTRGVAQRVSIPVIASGGAGNFDHMVQVLRDGHASAVAAASIYHFTHQTPLEAKQHLAEAGFPVRLYKPTLPS